MDVSYPVAFTIYAKWVLWVILSSQSLIASNLKGWSYSTISPYDKTNTLSLSIMVANLWAILITVDPLILFLTIDCIKLSVYKSTLAVASSNTNIF